MRNPDMNTDFSGRDRSERRGRRGPETGPFGPVRTERRRQRPEGEGRRGRHHGGGRGRRARRDVRSAVLLVLTEQPMHGYQLMHAIAERSNEAWRPSPGAIYPVLSQLEDEGLVTITLDAGRKVAELTETGAAAAETITETGTDPFAGDGEENGPDLRGSLHGLHQAAREVGRNGSPEQQERAREAIDAAKRQLYLILAEEN